jgi:hypothetical protein
MNNIINKFVLMDANTSSYGASAMRPKLSKDNTESLEDRVAHLECQMEQLLKVLSGG